MRQWGRQAVSARFNPLPSPKRGEMKPRPKPLVSAAVSIRSPHRSEGRSGVCSGPSSTRQGFNPLPSPKRGEIQQLACGGRYYNVSIRSPHRSEGRSVPSLPHKRVYGGFNPLPSPKRGEIFHEDAVTDYTLVSIRSPHRSEGRSLALCPCCEVVGQVSIRSPHRSEGRSAAVWCRRRNRSCFNPLPSPKRGEIMMAVVQTTTVKFQSAPLTEARGDHRRTVGCS